MVFKSSLRSGSGGTGTVTTTGSPVSGNLTQFSGPTSITNGDLSGDATTSGTLAVTVGKVNGVAYPSSPSINTVPVVTGTNAITYEAVPNAALANSTISGIALGSNLNSLTATDATLTFSGAYNGSAARTVGLNLSQANTWAALQTFGNNISYGGAQLNVTSLTSGDILQYNGTNWVNVAPSSFGVTSIAGTANQITASAATGAVTLSLPSAIISPGTLTVTTDLSVNGNTTIGDASGDTLTCNASAWTMPNSIVWAKTAQASTAESLLTWKVSDSATTMTLGNGTSNVNEFAPVFTSTVEPTFATSAIGFAGTKGVSTTPGNPAIYFLGRYNTGSGNTDIPDAGIMVEFRNRATSNTFFYGNGDAKIVNPKGTWGYGTGTGGTVTQTTSRTTGVTLSKSNGAITTDTTSLAAGATARFTVTNTIVAATDTIILSIKSGTTTDQTDVKVQAVAAGSFDIVVANRSASTAETGAIVINFSIMKAVTS